MEFGNLTIGHLLVVVVVFLLLFGAKRLPEMGQSLGKGLRAFKTGLSDVRAELEPGQRQDSLASREESSGVKLPDALEDDRREPKRLLP
jgi:sec-independent protein translocase protein TatA